MRFSAHGKIAAEVNKTKNSTADMYNFGGVIFVIIISEMPLIKLAETLWPFAKAPSASFGMHLIS